MDKFAGTTPDSPKDSADNLDNINEEDVDQAPTPGDDDDSTSGPAVSDAFRAGM